MSASDWAMEAAAEAMAEAEELERVDELAERIVGEMLQVALGVAVKLNWGPNEGANVRRVLDQLLWKLGFEPEPQPYRKRALSAATRRQILERDAYRCQWPGCGSWLDLTVDHIHPEIDGGSDDPANLQTLCRPHNSEKGVKL